MKTISERIKEGLDIRNMKQADLVEKTKIGKSSISTYISGEYKPKQENLNKIATALDVNTAWLEGHDVPMEVNTRYDLPNNSSFFIDMTEESFIQQESMALAIFDSVGELILDMSVIPGVKKLSDLFNDSKISLGSKIAILKSVVDVIKYDPEADEMTIYYKFNQIQEPSENLSILQSYKKLNKSGKKEALKRMEELTFIDKYIKKEEE